MGGIIHLQSLSSLEAEQEPSPTPPGSSNYWPQAEREKSGKPGFWW